jgi:GntR family transcriptional regulator
VDLDHGSPTPLYVQLADVLRGQIERGELTGRIPAAKSIAQQWEVAQGTAEKALTILRNEGLIVSHVGRGHFVKRTGNG